MSDIKVPEGMLEAAKKAACFESNGERKVEVSIKAALRWLSEHPIMPTDEQLHDMTYYGPTAHLSNMKAIHKGLIEEWQRRGFLRGQQSKEPHAPGMRCTRPNVEVKP